MTKQEKSERIAIEVMGWQVELRDYDYVRVFETQDKREVMRCDAWRPFERIDHAWMVWDRLKELGAHFVQINWNADFGILAVITVGNSIYRGTGEGECAAISEAALAMADWLRERKTEAAEKSEKDNSENGWTELELSGGWVIFGWGAPLSG